MANMKIELDEYYRITSAKGGVLEAEGGNSDNGAAVRLGDEPAADNGLWRFIPAGDGVYKLQNKQSQKVLDIAMAGISDGSWVHLWDNVDAASQLWAVVPAGSAGVKIRSALSGKVLDLVGGEDYAAFGAQAQIWQDVNGKRQLWQLEKLQTALPKEEGKAEKPQQENVQAEECIPVVQEPKCVESTAPAPKEKPAKKEATKKRGHKKTAKKK